MKIGYIRSGRGDAEDLNLQIQSLTEAGCSKIFTESMNESHSRPEFMALFEQLRDNDTVLVYKIDRMAHSLRELIGFIELLNTKKVNFISLCSDDNVDTTRPIGIEFLQVAKIFADLEKSMRNNRVNTGIKNARAKGIKLGRIPGCKNKKTIEKQDIIKNFLSEGMSYDWIAKELSVSKSTIANIKKSLG